MLACVADIRSFIAVWPVIELAFGIFWIASVWAAWSKFVPPTTIEDVGERELGATVILSQLNGIITAASIIIAGLGAFVALASDKRVASDHHLKLAAIFAAAALGLAVYTLSTLPTRAPRTNFVRSKEVAVLCSTALYLILLASFRFAIGVVSFLG